MAYAAPAKDTVTICGGLGTMADAINLNGGGATKAAWDAGSPSDFINTNGGPITSCVDASFATATKVFTSAGIGTGVTVGTLVQIFGGDGSHVTAGIYEVTAQTNDTITCANVDDDGSDDTNVSLRVGGAIGHTTSGLQELLDQPLNDATSYNRYIYVNGDTSSVGLVSTEGAINCDVNTGSASTKIYVIGYNSTLTAEAEVEVRATDAIATGLLTRALAKDYYEFRNIDFNGGGKDAGKAVYCLYGGNTTHGQYTFFYNCKFRGAENDGSACRTYNLYFVDCEFYLNGRYGYYSLGDSSSQGFMNCSIHDNDSHGIYHRIPGLRFINNLVYDNGKDGTGCGVYHSGGIWVAQYIGNTFYGNADDGIQLNSGDYSCIYANNAAIGNGAYGFDMQGIGQGDIGFFGFNLAGANTTAHYSEGADNTFADYSHGNNVASSQTADQLLETVTDGSEDFTPETGSDLIDAELGRTA